MPAVPLLEKIPIGKGRVRAFLHRPFESPKLVARVIKHPVDDDFNAAFMSALHKVEKQTVRPCHLPGGWIERLLIMLQM